MSKIAKINSEIVEVRGDLQKITLNQGLMKINRLFLTIIFSLMAVIVVLGFSWFSYPISVSGYKNATVSDVMEMNPLLSQEVSALKGQLVGLVSGSIESKLLALEESVRRGAVANSLGTIEDLKNDIKVLHTYSEATKKDQAAVASDHLMQEMTQLKKLIYTTLASCGLMLAAVAGIWIKNSNLLPHKKVKTSFLGGK